MTKGRGGSGSEVSVNRRYGDCTELKFGPVPIIVSYMKQIHQMAERLRPFKFNVKLNMKIIIFQAMGGGYDMEKNPNPSKGLKMISGRTAFKI